MRFVTFVPSGHSIFIEIIIINAHTGNFTGVGKSFDFIFMR